MKTTFALTLLFLCCIPGPPVALCYLEQEEHGKEEILGGKGEENGDAANPQPVVVEVPVRDGDPDDGADYEKAGGYEDDKEKQAGQEEAVKEEEDDKIKVRV